MISAVQFHITYFSRLLLSLTLSLKNALRFFYVSPKSFLFLFFSFKFYLALGIFLFFYCKEVNRSWRSNSFVSSSSSIPS